MDCKKEKQQTNKKNDKKSRPETKSGKKINMDVICSWKLVIFSVVNDYFLETQKIKSIGRR